MGDRLEGKVAFVTGGGAGIGRASAIAFARQGARVAIADINESDALETVARIEAENGSAKALRVDLTKEDEVYAAFDAFDEWAGGALHVLYNCAGGSTNADGAVDELTLDTLQHTLEVDLHSAVLCSRSGVPRIISSGGGSIINMSSFAAHRGAVRIHAYAAAKGAISSLTKAMAGSYAKEGIRVNAIAPGAALTERASRRLNEPNVNADLTFDWKDYPFAVGQPEDIAAVALFLASDESKMITGQTLMADGGLTAY
jgi:NAD(P)-dependent dehydrogenase (short-subunit alcohol dehydrogenase family)